MSSSETRRHDASLWACCVAAWQVPCPSPHSWTEVHGLTQLTCVCSLPDGYFRGMVGATEELLWAFSPSFARGNLLEPQELWAATSQHPPDLKLLFHTLRPSAPLLPKARESVSPFTETPASVSCPPYLHFMTLPLSGLSKPPQVFASCHLICSIPALLLPLSPVTLAPCLCFWGIPPLASLSLTSGLHVELIEEWPSSRGLCTQPWGQRWGEFGPSLLL